MKTITNVIKIAFSNMVSFGTSFIISFILPKILSIAQYGEYKQYTLYLTITYLFNFGFNDGITIKYGGGDLNEIDRQEVQREHSYLLKFQLIILSIMMIFSFILKDKLLAFFSIATFFNAIITFNQNFYQAIGNFSPVSKGNILKSVFYIVTLVFGMLILKAKDSDTYIIINILSYIFWFLYMEIFFMKSIGIKLLKSDKNVKKLFRVGIYILISNMSLTFVGSIGNWFVNWGYTVEEFAQYSFQNSLLNVVLLVVNAVGIVFYNILAKYREMGLAIMIKRVCIFLGIFSGLVFFVFSLVINKFLHAYTPSINLLSITFISIPYLMASRILIANIFKTMRSEKKYFIISILYALLSLLFVGFTQLIFKNMFSIAISTTLCYVFWYIFATRMEFMKLKDNKKEIILLIIHAIVFYITANSLSILMGTIVYFIFCILVVLVFEKEIRGIVKFIKEN